MESTVNFNTKLKEAASFGQPITEYDPGSRGYKDFVNLARELMGHRPVDPEPTPMDKTLAGRRSWCSEPSNWPNSPTAVRPQYHSITAEWKSGLVAATRQCACRRPGPRPRRSVDRLRPMRGPMLAGRLSEQPVEEPAVLALSSDEEELSDAAAHPPSPVLPAEMGMETATATVTGMAMAMETVTEIQMEMVTQPFPTPKPPPRRSKNSTARKRSATRSSSPPASIRPKRC